MARSVLEVGPHVIFVHVEQLEVDFGLESQDFVVVLDESRQHLYVLVKTVLPETVSQLQVCVEF